MLRDAVSSSGLNLYAVIALVLFFAAFVAVIVYVWRKPKGQTDREARLPLDDGPEPMQQRNINHRLNKNAEGARHG